MSSSLFQISRAMFFLGGLFLVPSNQGAASAPLSKGQVVFETSFDEEQPLQSWTGASRLAPGYQSVHSLEVAVDAGEKGGRTVSHALPAASLRGCTVMLKAMMKAENVSARPNPWNGLKFMLAQATPDQQLWPQAALPDGGTFGWQPVRFTTRIPDDVTRVTLILGLEQVTGKVWFDQVKISVIKLPQTASPPLFPGPMFKGHTLGRLRGAMVGPHLTEESLKVFGADWKGNLIRWQLIRHGKPGQPSSLEDYDAWLDGQINKLDEVLTWCARYGVMVVVDLHSPPGGKATVSGYIGSDDRLFSDRAVQDKFVRVWERLATRYRGNRVIWGFDLANEPVETLAEDVADWHDLAERAALAVRAVDPERTLIVECPDWGSPDGFQGFSPIAVSNVVYSAHMYVPGAFTHQGVHKKDGKKHEYPGVIDGKQWDRAALELALKPVVDFQKRFNVHIYIGEFSAIRWAPNQSALRYLSDVIEIFEAHDWDWSYHAFREWQGWSVEHAEDPGNTAPAPQPTERQQLLQRWFAKNRAWR